MATTIATTAGTLSRDQLELLVTQAGFPAATRATAVAVALAESSGRTGVISSTGDYGLWQINHKAHPNYSTARLLQDPLYNARAALTISKNGTDWSPWVAYKTGAYRNQLQGAAGLPDPGTVIDVGGQIIEQLPGLIPGVPDVNPLDPSTWVSGLTAGIAQAALALLLVAAGLGLAGYGLTRITNTGDATKKLIGAAGPAGLAASLIVP